MNDYEELIDKLRVTGMTEGHCEILLNAADAIEQLVKERNVAVDDITNIVHDMGNTCICDYCVGCEKDGYHDECKTDEGDSWQWRGLREIE